MTHRIPLNPLCTVWLAALVTLTACESGGGGESEPADKPASEQAAAVAPQFSGKADVKAPPVLGSLAFGEAQASTFAALNEWHSWTLDAEAGAEARIEITQKGTSKTLDTLLMVYAPDGKGGYLPQPVAVDDDSGWGRQSRLTLRFEAPGEHLVLVGSWWSLGTGAYRLSASCLSDSCAPTADPAADPSAAECPQEVLTEMKRCVDGLRFDEDDERVRLLHADEEAALCTDAEYGGQVYDAVCIFGEGGAFCDGNFESFAANVLPACEEPLQTWAAETSCVFGYQWNNIGDNISWEVAQIARRSIQSDAGLSALEIEQVLETMELTGVSGLSSVDEAAEWSDDGEIIQTLHWDLTSGQPFASYIYYSGDTLIGAVFEELSIDEVAVINDGSVDACEVPIGPAMKLCATSDDCGADLQCAGPTDAAVANGRCIDPKPLPGEFDSCGPGDASPCPAASGLLCVGATEQWEGLCSPAYAHAEFVDGSGAFVAANGDVERVIDVSGLLSVVTAVEVGLELSHSELGSVVVTLENPDGTVGTVFDGAAAENSSGVFDDIRVSGFPGDESVNGPWKLRIQNDSSGSGTLFRWVLRLGSRWD